MALAPDYDPLADAIRANDPPPNVTATLPADYDPLADAERRQASPLKVPYQNGKPMDQGTQWATDPTADEYGGKPGGLSEFLAEPVVSGALRGARDVIDTGAHALASTAATVAPVDVDAIRASDKAIRDEWEKQHSGSTAAQVGRVAGQIGATAGPVGLVGRGINLATTGIPAAVRLLLQGAGQGATQAGLTASGYDQPTGEQIARGAVTGGAAAPVIGGLTRAIDALRGFYGGIRPEIADLANRAGQRGIDIPVNAMVTNPQLKMFTNALRSLPGTGEDAAALARQRQFQGAMMGEAGSTADTVGNAEMTAMRNRISDGYDAALNRVTEIPHSPQLIGDLANVGVDATRYLDPTTAGFVGRAIREVHNAFGDGPITGAAYKSLTASDGPLARITAAAPETARPYFNQISDALRQQLTRSAPPGTAADLLRLDQEWRAMHTIRPLAEKSAAGDIQPAALLQSVINQSRKFDGPASGVAFSDATLPELGRIGKQFFGHIPESGTAPRTQAYNFARHPLAFTAGLAPGLALGRPLRAWLDSPTVSRRVIDTSLGAPVPDASRFVPPVSLLGLDAQR
jgi:hypothetical protein